MPHVRVNPPVNATPEILAKLDPLDYGFDRGTVSEHRNVSVTRSGACFHRGIPIRDSHYRYAHLWPRHLAIAYGSLLTRKTEALEPDKVYCLGHNLWSGGYYHWMTESLPRLLRLKERSDELTCIIPPFARLSKVVPETVQALGYSDLVEYPQDSNIRVEQLVLPSNPARLAECDPAAMREIRDLCLTRFGRPINGEAGPSRLYVTRSKARGRKVANEAAVEECLHARGFVTVAFEDYSFPEQVALMSSAEIMVSIHGAGLTNMIFMRPGGAVVELLQDPVDILETSRARRSRKAPAIYGRLASIMGFSYFVHFCRVAPDQPGNILGDVTVDPGELSRIVDQAVEMTGRG